MVENRRRKEEMGAQGEAWKRRPPLFPLFPPSSHPANFYSLPKTPFDELTRDAIFKRSSLPSSHYSHISIPTKLIRLDRSYSVNLSLKMLRDRIDAPLNPINRGQVRLDCIRSRLFPSFPSNRSFFDYRDLAHQEKRKKISTFSRIWRVERSISRGASLGVSSLGECSCN